MWKIPLFDLNYDEREYNAVREVLESKWLSSGPKIQEFEHKFSSYLGSGVNACAVSSCTAALHISLILADVRSGDEVIVSGLTFIADLNVVILTGATPVLADSISLDNWNVSAADIGNKITPKTKAVIIVHYAGYPCDINAIQKICKEKNIILIEDVAHAIGASVSGRKCGTFGDVACFSFFSNKNLSIGEGGMVVTSKEEYNKKARLLRSHGMTSMTIDRHEGKAISYDVVMPGLNYRMDEIRAALGIVQLEKLDNCNAKRKNIVSRYIKNLESVSSVIIPFKKLKRDIVSSYHIFPILLPQNIDRDAVINSLKKEGIQTSIHYPAFKIFSYYRKVIQESIPVSESISERVLTLPLYPDMTNEQVDYICDKLIYSLKQ